ncbi:hypothetical protein COLO4_23779 [Corchorus olitorius]|uniref:KIB1-4 beta-propeller domain-containing protein n=1 Tax=Corchorus olitorius TaxID=93759 RepID=A0A1R3IEU3_9ROSI|nr:hypothetical protein COLO4_23779 [Corchorus olitorius]
MASSFVRLGLFSKPAAMRLKSGGGLSSLKYSPFLRNFTNSSAAATTTTQPLPSLRSPSDARPWPLLMLPSTDYYLDDSITAANFSFYSPIHNQILHLWNRVLPEEITDPFTYCAGSTSNGLLVYINSRKYEIYLANLFSQSSNPTVEIIKLPAMTSEPRVHKIVLSSSPDDENCIVLVVDSFTKSLSFCKIGDKTWNQIIQPDITKSGMGKLVDVMYSNKDELFHCLRFDGGVESWDIRNPSNITKMSQAQFISELGQINQRLVETPTGGGIYISNSWRKGTEDILYEGSKFYLQGIDFQRGICQKVESIGNQAMFLGCNYSFSVSIDDFPELKPDTVYFSDPMVYQRIHCSQFMWKYNVKDESVDPIAALSDYSHKAATQPIWVFANLCK